MLLKSLALNSRNMPLLYFLNFTFLQILRFSFVMWDLRCCFCEAQKYKEQALESPSGGQKIRLTTELLETGLGGLELQWVYCSLLCQFLDLDCTSALSSLKQKAH